MSKQRNFRPRSKLALEEEEDDTAAVKPSGASAKPAQAQPKQAKAGAASKPGLLSFGEDGEGEDTSIPIMSKKKDKDRGKSKFRGAIPLPEVPVVTTASQRTGAGEDCVGSSRSIPEKRCFCWLECFCPLSGMAGACARHAACIPSLGLHACLE